MHSLLLSTENVSIRNTLLDSYYLHLFLGKSKEASHQGETNKGETLQSLSLFQSTRAFSIKYKLNFFKSVP